MSTVRGMEQPGSTQQGGARLRILTYNVFLRPLPWLLRDGQAQRVKPLVGYLSACDADVLVLNELLDDASSARLLAGLKETFPFQTPCVGERAFVRRKARAQQVKRHGGVAIVSRIPFDAHAECRFGARAVGDDRLADKGIMYVRLQHVLGAVHLFGLHANAQRYGKRARVRQFELLRSFVDVQGIPPSEPVLMAGDFNVDADSPELGAMLTSLDAVVPELRRGALPSFDSTNNRMARGRREHLDYVLWSARHRAPSRCHNVTLRPVAEPWSQRPFYRGCTELSDHFPVLGEFEFR